jgi:pimeloyl-ACP methyl ester carboxylesterase
VLKALVGSLEPRLVFFPHQGEDGNPAALGIRYEAVPLTTSDGERLIAWQLEPDVPLADIVYFHGNGGNLSLWLPVLATLHRLSYRVLAVDYRGYGRSSGAPSEEGLYRDAEATVRHAARHRSSPRPLVFWGRSLGATVAASATHIVQPDGLILESGFPEKAAVIRTHLLFRALNILSSYRFPTVELLGDFRKPVLVLHGTRDSIIPFALGRELFERLEAPKQFVAIEGADHNDFFEEGRTAYWTPISRFINGLTTP